MREFESASVEGKREMLTQVRTNTAELDLTKSERKNIKKRNRQELVKRSALLKIAAAWVITVPAAGLMAGFLFYAIRGMMLP